MRAVEVVHLICGLDDSPEGSVNFSLLAKDFTLIARPSSKGRIDIFRNSKRAAHLGQIFQVRGLFDSGKLNSRRRTT
jgi:hypothetical protein